MTHRAAQPAVAHTGTLPEFLPSEATPIVERLALRLDEVAASLGVSRRAIERERSAGRFPRPDVILGRRMPLWRVETIKAWLEGGGR
jgi:predicted DNA-binding transcriptional regulator AlpA